MKICWDNLQNLKYNNGVWYDKHYTKYIYKDACKNCGEPFLSQKGKGEFCDYFCSNGGENHPSFGKKLSEEHIKIIKYTNKGRLRSEETKIKIGRSNSGKNCNWWKGGVKKKNIPLYDTYADQISFCERVRRNNEDLNILEVKCAYCGKWYIPKQSDIRHRIQSLENQIGECRLYCSTTCKQECPIYNQKLWPKGFKPATSREVQPELRQMCFERDGFTCQKCGKHKDELDVGLHCHHVEGIRWEPLESSDLDKVITFCKNCHIEVHKLPGCKYHEMRCG